MIKFFRKIRYNLMETGKTSRYFKYAIGEIILVVIGILIALQINNWNENRKQQQVQNVLLKKYLQDLEVDFSNFQSYLFEIKQIDSLHQDLFNMVLNNIDVEIKKPVLVRKGIFFNTLAKDNNPEITTQISREAIRSVIQEYYKNIVYADNLRAEHKVVIGEIRDYLRKNGIHNFKEWAQARVFDNVITTEALTELVKDSYFQQLLFESSLKILDFKTELESVIAINQNLYSLINEHLNHDQ